MMILRIAAVVILAIVLVTKIIDFIAKSGSEETVIG